MKLTLRDLFWAIMICSLALAWWVDRGHFKREQAVLRQILPAEIRDPILQAWRISRAKWPLQSVRQEENDEFTIQFGWGTRSVGAGEVIRLKKVGGTWQVIKQDEFDA